ncbi:M50 family metallopeptidase [Williamsia deligens]|uniref:Zinc metalloprotease Rip1 n=1 Tax=Williamsia deligens TaxID=321325 RepID=A0ABW3GBY1_9NOCA|nr:site-2 protease family protein [Williamsia deligens]MCP2195520.1 RIP metalloprotease RseP [Williamsia deligens]
MGFIIGVVVFALGLLLSIAWHECGHMWAAQRTGMVVRRYFVGFGPTLWSTRRGDTEYGIKAIPLGGFCDIAGMTTYDEVAPEHADRAMFRQKAWKRLVVLLAGPAQNFILGFVLIVILAIGWGLPNLNAPPPPAKVATTDCVSSTIAGDGTSSPCTGTGPAAAAGLLPGDQILSVNGANVTTAAQMTPLVRYSSGPLDLAIRRDGVVRQVQITPDTVTYQPGTGTGLDAPLTVRQIGISYPQTSHKDFSVVGAVPGAVVFTGQLAHATWDSLIALPQKVGALWTAVTGGERAADTPVSVLGATVIGGQAAERGLWQTFVLLLVSINFFLGLFNLVPLLPLDGGHMAIVGYEKIRDTIRRRLGMSRAGPVDYLKLMPATYAVLAVMGSYMVLTLTADIVNPLKLF